MKKTEKMSVKEVISITARAYKLLYKLSPQLMTSKMIKTILDALTPYVGIYLSAQIISELAGARSPERLRWLVLLTLCSAAAIALIGALLSRCYDAKTNELWIKYQHLFVEKDLSMDFVRLDSPDTHKLKSTIMQNTNGGGWGLTRLVWGRSGNLIAPIFSILGGLTLTVSLFTSRVPESAGAWTFLNNPVFLAVLITVMIAVPCVSSAISNLAESYYAKHSADHNLANRLFGWFEFLGFKQPEAANMRVFGIDKICMAHNLDKTGVFGSEGFFAKLSRGKVGFLSMASIAVTHIFTFIVYLYVCLKAWAGAFGVGGIMQYVGAVSAIAGSVGDMLANWGDVRNNAPFLKLTFEYLDLPNEMYQGSLTTEKRSDRDYEIEFRDVSFRYPGSESYALSHVSIKFRIGERLAVVGRNGSGKTTFIKLLCRLYDPTEGQILLNGIDIRKYDYYQYMDIFSVVFQDFKLFPYKLGQNVASAEEYDAARVSECLEKVGFGERLTSLENGLDTYLYKDSHDDGINISGGEAQKIAIARALCKDAPFIILDEPTAALDPIAEAEVYANFNRIVKDCTTIYISHRLSSCRFCDAIAVFDEGRVVQFGPHDSLIADENGTYALLWNAQAQYYDKKS